MFISIINKRIIIIDPNFEFYKGVEIIKQKASMSKANLVSDLLLVC